MWYYSNTSVPTTLINDIDATATSIQIGDTSGLPIQYPYTLVLDFEGTAMEVVNVTSAAGTSLIIQRGQDGTSAQPHIAGAVVVHAAVARDLQEPQDHIASSQNVHGIGSSSFVVGTNTPQILAGKTIDGNFNTLLNLPANQISGDFVNLSVAGDVVVGSDGLGTLTVNGSTIAADNVSVTRPATGSWSYRTQVTGDLDPRWVVFASGQLNWGDGTARDTNLYRSAPNVLATDDSFTVGGILTAGAVNATGASTFNTTTFTQNNASSPAVLINAHAAPTSPALRVVGDESFAGVEIRRNSSTTTGDMLRFATETGATMAAYDRRGNLALNQLVAPAAALVVAPHATPTSPTAVITGAPATSALSIRRNNSTTTGNLQDWSTESANNMAWVTRQGEIVGSNLRAINDVTVGADGSGDLVVGGGDIIYRGMPQPVIQSGIQLMTFASATSSFVDVTFPIAYPGGVTPAVVATINNISGISNGWWVRAANVTNTGFRMSVSSGSAAAWSNVPVSWIASADL